MLGALVLILALAGGAFAFELKGFVCEMPCQIQCEYLLVEPSFLSDEESCWRACVNWKRANCSGLCTEALGPFSNGTVFEYNGTPGFVSFDHRLLSFCIEAKEGIYFAAAIFGDNGTRLWWINGECRTTQEFPEFSLQRVKKVSCFDVELPTLNGTFAWLLSEKPLPEVDWERDRYFLGIVRFNATCSSEHLSYCRSEEECRAAGGNWCLWKCQEEPCLRFSCGKDCSASCENETECLMECTYYRALHCPEFSCAYNCNRYCGFDRECIRSCSSWQALNCASGVRFVCDASCVSFCGGDARCLDVCLGWVLNNCLFCNDECLSFCGVYARGDTEFSRRCVAVCTEYKREFCELQPWVNSSP